MLYYVAGLRNLSAPSLGMFRSRKSAEVLRILDQHPHLHPCATQRVRYGMDKGRIARTVAPTIKGLRCHRSGGKHSVFHRSISNSCPRRAEDDPPNTATGSPAGNLSSIFQSQVSASRATAARSTPEVGGGVNSIADTTNLLSRYRDRRGGPPISSRFDTFLNPANNLPVGSVQPPHGFYVYATKHNTHITLTRPSRDPILSVAAGNIGFKKAARGSYDAAYQLAAYVMGRIQEQGLMAQIQQLEVVLRGFGAGREAVTKALLGSEGRNLRGRVVRVTDATRLKFGGTRSPKPRRLG